MPLLDTHVLSEVMRPKPSTAVLAWLDEQDADQIWVSTISRAEIALGIALLPDGLRKQGLRQAALAMFDEEFWGRSLVFDDQAADRYAVIVAQRRKQGRPISVEDAQIAAIALTQDLAIATRNSADFEGIEGLLVINPWGN